jgi:hypothetical protein
MTHEIRIHQIYYEPRQRPLLDPAFIPLDNTRNERPEWCEYHVFRTQYHAGVCAAGQLTGFMSWKFRQKTRMSGGQFIGFIRRNPGHDVYCINPYPKSNAIFRNVWAQGEHFHPGLRDLARRCLDAAGLDLPLDGEHTDAITCYCNYWVGTRPFWDLYMSYAERLFDVIETRLDTDTRARLDARAQYDGNASFLPFVIERLFTTILFQHTEVSVANLRCDHWWTRLTGRSASFRET